MGNLKAINVGLTVSSFIGLGLSIYSYFIEQQHDSYKAYCDISDYISCSKTFKSPYGTGFGIIGETLGKDSILNIPNCLLGIVCYSLLIILAQSNNKLITAAHFGSSIASVLMSGYLAYVMVMKINTICVICLTTYVVNMSNLILGGAKLRCLGNSEKKLKRN